METSWSRSYLYFITKQDMGDAFVVLVAPRKPQLEAIAKAVEEARLLERFANEGFEIWDF